MTVVITDARYRSAIAAVRTLGRAGCRVILTQTRGDCTAEPPAFSSRYAADTCWIEGKNTDADYPDRLLALLRELGHPVLFCVGASTLQAVSAQKGRFSAVCDLLIADPEVLDALNDKACVRERAAELGIPVPAQYTGEPERYPVIVKPRCGEKFGLKAAERYRAANSPEEYRAALEIMRRYDPAPLVQEKLSGDGIGVSLLLGRDGALLGAICHRRIREYPVTGGPSTCCESFYDESMIADAHRLLASFGFCGLAMVEFKGSAVLEVNPRVWGSFPLTACAQSPILLRYAEAAQGTPSAYAPCDYRTGVRMRFLVNDTAAALSLLLHGKWKKAWGGVLDVFRAKEALRAKDDPKPMRKYLKNTLTGKS